MDKEMKDGGKCEGGGCCCFCHKMVGIKIALIGLVFLLGNLGVLGGRAVGILWPALLILIGLKKAFKGMCRCCSGG